MRRFSVIFILISVLVCSCRDNDGYERERWLELAKKSTPVLVERDVRPVAEVEAVYDENAFQGWRYENKCTPSFYERSFKQVKEVTLDLGDHYTGYFSFHTKTISRCQDAPIRFKFTFGELPAEMNTPLDPWKGDLCRAWMQDEVVTVTEVDKWITLDRRMSCRYIRIELLAGARDFDFCIDDIKFTSVSSAAEVKTELKPDCPEEIRNIERVAERTLAECMQTVFEDGPKRDHRLWSGDLYLQSLANRYSFRNFELVKHCLYLFAALADENGVIVSNIFEHPEPHPQYGSYCLPYCLLWNSTLLEYLKDTGDRTTALDLWKVARRQVEDALTYVRDDGIFDETLRDDNVWLFFDWREGLDVSVAIQGATIFALKQTYELAQMLGKEEEVSFWPEIAKKMSFAALEKMYDKESGVFLSGRDRQLSILSQTWMIKSGVISGEDGSRAIRAALSDCSDVMPGTPYATHYLVDAMILCGMESEARNYLLKYWGGMVRKGADTFWEAYDPEDDFLSPYNFFPVNSACHAWSCTPIYFIHRYPEIFQTIPIETYSSKSISAGEPLRSRILRNQSRLDDDIYRAPEAFEDKDWPGDYIGRIILALVMDSHSLHTTSQHLEELMRDLPSYMNHEGYMGALCDSVINEQSLSGHGWLLRGLCEYYKDSGDTVALNMVSDIANKLYVKNLGRFASYPISTELRTTQGGEASGMIASKIDGWMLSTDVGCVFIGMAGLVDAYEICPNNAIKETIDEMVGRFLEVDLTGINAQTHATLSALRGLLKYSDLTADERLFKEVVKRWDLYVKEGMTCTYANYNWFGKKDTWTEPCAIIDSYILSYELWKHTMLPEYREMAELIYINAICRAQRANGGFGCESCPSAENPELSVKVPEAHWCCTMRGAEGLFRVAESCFVKRGNSIILPIFQNSKINTDGIELTEITDYPVSGKVTLAVSSNKYGFDELLYPCMPWAEDEVVLLNGKEIDVSKKMGCKAITHKFAAGDVIEITFNLPLRTDEWDGMIRKFRGPVLLGLDKKSGKMVPIAGNMDNGMPLQVLFAD